MNLRRTPMVRKTPLKAGQPLPRGGFLRRGSFVPKRPQVTSAERKARKLLRRRSGDVCELHGGHAATEAHHRVNRSQGGRWDVANLLHLCHEAHLFCTTNPQAAREQGWSAPSHRDPADVPVWLARVGYVFLNSDGSITEVDDEEGAA